jgi:hypothetical protein
MPVCLYAKRSAESLLQWQKRICEVRHGHPQMFGLVSAFRQAVELTAEADVFGAQILETKLLYLGHNALT